MATPSHFPIIAGRCGKFVGVDDEEEEEGTSHLPWDVKCVEYGGHGSDDDDTENPISPDFDSTDLSDISNMSRSFSPTSMSDSSDDEYVDAVDHEQEANSEQEHLGNVVVDERPTSTRVIIRPIVRRASSLLSLLSRSSPTPNNTRASTPSGTRPSSPLHFTFGALKLNRFHNSSDPFERQVDYLEEQGIREGSGAARVQVLVVTEVTVRREELWREGVQQVLYGQRVETALKSRSPMPLLPDYHSTEI